MEQCPALLHIAAYHPLWLSCLSNFEVHLVPSSGDLCPVISMEAFCLIFLPVRFVCPNPLAHTHLTSMQSTGRWAATDLLRNSHVHHEIPAGFEPSVKAVEGQDYHYEGCYNYQGSESSWYSASSSSQMTVEVRTIA